MKRRYIESISLRAPRLFCLCVKHHQVTFTMRSQSFWCGSTSACGDAHRSSLYQCSRAADISAVRHSRIVTVTLWCCAPPTKHDWWSKGYKVMCIIISRHSNQHVMNWDFYSGIPLTMNILFVMHSTTGWHLRCGSAASHFYLQLCCSGLKTACGRHLLRQSRIKTTAVPKGISYMIIQNTWYTHRTT